MEKTNKDNIILEPSNDGKDVEEEDEIILKYGEEPVDIEVYVNYLRRKREYKERQLQKIK